MYQDGALYSWICSKHILANMITSKNEKFQTNSIFSNYSPPTHPSTRMLLHGQETFEDYDSCGIFGEGEKAATTNRARIGDEYDCLWDCQWQVNPFFKSGDNYATKLGTKGYICLCINIDVSSL